ncbi:MAG: ion transporter [Candidatus Woesearchaeota archaeon]|nr:ion transporter [Candidatus Woesearchaeota archaeon]
MNYRKRTYQLLENPRTPFEKFISYFLLVLIFVSIFILAFEVYYPDVASTHKLLLQLIELAIVFVFSLEYLVRILVTPRPFTYIFSFGGIIDLLAILPNYLMAFLPGHPLLARSEILRSLRIIRFFRVLKLWGRKKTYEERVFKNTILGRVFPYLVIMFIAKVFIFLLETNGYWFTIDDLETVFGVVGFAIGLILSQKLGIAYGKIILVEDALLRVVGSLQSMRQYLPKKLIQLWAMTLIAVLESKKKATLMTAVHEKLGKATKKKRGVAQYFAFHEYRQLSQDLQFILNRAVIETPPVYDIFLKRITIVYTVLLIVFLPGYIGLISVLVAAFVLGGMYLLIEDMDRAIDVKQKHLVNADMSALYAFTKE